MVSRKFLVHDVNHRGDRARLGWLQDPYWAMYSLKHAPKRGKAPQAASLRSKLSCSYSKKPRSHHDCSYVSPCGSFSVSGLPLYVTGVLKLASTHVSPCSLLNSCRGTPPTSTSISNFPCFISIECAGGSDRAKDEVGK